MRSELLKCKWALDEDSVAASDDNWHDVFSKHLWPLSMGIGGGAAAIYLGVEWFGVLLLILSAVLLPPTVGAYHYSQEVKDGA